MIAITLDILDIQDGLSLNHYNPILARYRANDNPAGSSLCVRVRMFGVPSFSLLFPSFLHALHPAVTMVLTCIPSVAVLPSFFFLNPPHSKSPISFFAFYPGDPDHSGFRPRCHSLDPRPPPPPSSALALVLTKPLPYPVAHSLAHLCVERARRTLG